MSSPQLGARSTQMTPGSDKVPPRSVALAAKSAFKGAQLLCLPAQLYGQRPHGTMSTPHAAHNIALKGLEPPFKRAQAPSQVLRLLPMPFQAALMLYHPCCKSALQTCPFGLLTFKLSLVVGLESEHRPLIRSTKLSL